jgi:acetylornithine/N-succinyldiaminopimelate aminotransferase
MLIFDEMQTGIGRTGKLFAYDARGVAPDIMSIAKGIGGGFPIGACLATEEAGQGHDAGTHGTTFGGNPLAMAVGNAVLDVMLAPGFLDEVRRRRCASSSAGRAEGSHPQVIADVRGEGLMLGSSSVDPNGDIRRPAPRRKACSCVAAGDNVVRLLPPLIFGESRCRRGMARIDAACGRGGARPASGGVSMMHRRASAISSI